MANQDMKHMRGLRYHCTTCPGFDLCYKCVLSKDIIHPNHVIEPPEDSKEYDVMNPEAAAGDGDEADPDADDNDDDDDEEEYDNDDDDNDDDDDNVEDS
jgi:hypothetical protein